jgi:hypothetical protein
VNEIQQFWGRLAAAIELGHHNDVVALEMVKALIGVDQVLVKSADPIRIEIFAYGLRAGDGRIELEAGHLGR